MTLFSIMKCYQQARPGFRSFYYLWWTKVVTVALFLDSVLIDYKLQYYEKNIPYLHKQLHQFKIIKLIKNTLISVFLMRIF